MSISPSSILENLNPRLTIVDFGDSEEKELEVPTRYIYPDGKRVLNFQLKSQFAGPLTVEATRYSGKGRFFFRGPSWRQFWISSEITSGKRLLFAQNSELEFSVLVFWGSGTICTTIARTAARLVNDFILMFISRSDIEGPVDPGVVEDEHEYPSWEFEFHKPIDNFLVLDAAFCERAKIRKGCDVQLNATVNAEFKFNTIARVGSVRGFLALEEWATEWLTDVCEVEEGDKLTFKKKENVWLTIAVGIKKRAVSVEQPSGKLKMSRGETSRASEKLAKRSKHSKLNAPSSPVPMVMPAESFGLISNDGTVPAPGPSGPSTHLDVGRKQSIKISPTNIYQLCVPREFAEAAKLTGREMISLRSDGGQLWSVKVSRGLKNYRLSAGWCKFYRKMNLGTFKTVILTILPEEDEARFSVSLVGRRKRGT